MTGAVIIGSGSVWFEMLRHPALVLPVMVGPRLGHQDPVPARIGIADVLQQLNRLATDWLSE